MNISDWILNRPPLPAVLPRALMNPVTPTGTGRPAPAPGARRAGRSRPSAPGGEAVGDKRLHLHLARGHGRHRGAGHCGAPTSRAMRQRSSSVSTAMSWAGRKRRANCMTKLPTRPWPSTATRSSAVISSACAHPALLLASGWNVPCSKESSGCSRCRGCGASAAVERREYSACGAVATTRSPAAKPVTPSPPLSESYVFAQYSI